jgi:hypothetical protein
MLRAFDRKPAVDRKYGRPSRVPSVTHSVRPVQRLWASHVAFLRSARLATAAADRLAYPGSGELP